MATVDKKKVRYLVFFAIIIAIEAIFCFTPLGSIPIGPLVATLAMLPVCLTGVLLGVKGGSLLGFIAGLFSFIYWSFIAPGVMSLAFTPLYKFQFTDDITFGGSLWTLVICFVPRILTGTVAALVYKAIAGKTEKNAVKVTGAAVAGIAGSLTNTIGVLGGIALFMGKEFGAIAESYEAYGSLWGFILVTFLTNSIAEAVVSGIVTPAAVPIKRLISDKI